MSFSREIEGERTIDSSLRHDHLPLFVSNANNKITCLISNSAIMGRLLDMV